MNPILLVLILSAGPLKISMDRAVRIALKNNLTLRAKKQELFMAEQDVLKARSSLYPTIKGQATYTRLSEEQKTTMLSGLRLSPTGNPRMPFMIAPEFSEIKTTYFNNYGLSLSVSQPIFTWGALRGAYRLSQKKLKSVNLEVRSTSLEIEEKVRESYINLLLARRSLDLLQQIESELKENLKSTRERYQAGYASDFELLRAKVQLRSIEPQIIQVKGQIKVAEDAFRNLLGLPDTVEFELTDSLYHESINQSLDSLIQEAYRSHVSIRLMEENIRLLEESIKLQRKRNLPTIFYSWNYKYQRPFGMQDEWHGMWTFTLGASWNLFDGGANKADVARLNYQLKSLKISLKSVKNGIKLAVKNYYTSLLSLEESLKSQESNLDLAKRAYEMAKKQYDEGYATSLDVLNAEIQYAQARLNYLKTLAQYMITLTRLNYSVRGGIDKSF